MMNTHQTSQPQALEGYHYWFEGNADEFASIGEALAAYPDQEHLPNSLGWTQYRNGVSIAEGSVCLDPQCYCYKWWEHWRDERQADDRILLEVVKID
jgi:hypothetical protein